MRSQKEAVALRLGIDLGMTLIDTAEMYAGDRKVMVHIGYEVVVFHTAPDLASLTRDFNKIAQSARIKSSNHQEPVGSSFLDAPSVADRAQPRPVLSSRVYFIHARVQETASCLLDLQHALGGVPGSRAAHRAEGFACGLKGNYRADPFALTPLSR